MTNEIRGHYIRAYLIQWRVELYTQTRGLGAIKIRIKIIYVNILLYIIFKYMINVVTCYTMIYCSRFVILLLHYYVLLFITLLYIV